jgi:hypothetical protein
MSQSDNNLENEAALFDVAFSHASEDAVAFKYDISSLVGHP